ncbi:MAG: hypothetical protein ACTHU0_19210 [Kofleriaceae bacterium]
MTSAPFRDLFAELPRALFETLRGIGEAAVALAESRASASTPGRRSQLSALSEALQTGTLATAICQRYGWSSLEVSRHPSDAALLLCATLPCGHRLGWLRVDEQLLEDAGNPGMVLLRQLDDLARHSPKCGCAASKFGDENPEFT